MFTDYFNSKENHRILFTILSDYLVNAHKISQQDVINLNIHTRLQGLMTSISSRININEFRHLSTKEDKVSHLNKIVLNKCIPGFSGLIVEYQKQREIEKNKEVDSITRPIVSTNRNQTNHVNIMFENLSKQRNNIDQSREKPYVTQNYIDNNLESISRPLPDTVKKSSENNNNNDMVKNMINFENQQKSFKSKEVEFQNRLNQLKAQRENFFQENLVEKEESKDNLISREAKLSSSIDYLKNNKNDINLENDSIKPVDKKYNDNFLKMSEIIPKNIDSNLATIPNEPVNKNKDMGKEVIDTCLVVVNASDRKWYGNWTTDQDGNDILSASLNQNRYNFTIKFSSDQDETNLIYIKESLKNIKTIEISDVILSTHDNPSLIGINKKDIVIENITKKDIVNPDTKETEEVVKKIKTHDHCKVNKYIYYNIHMYPYLLINIKEYSGNLVTTNNRDRFTGRLVIGKNYVNNSFCRNNDIVQGYMLMKPLVSTNNCSINFSPTPLPNLDKLTVSLNKPNGDLYASENAWNIDNLSIIGIDLCDDCINICVYPPFHPSMYLCGDSINIKRFEFLKIEECLVKIKDTLTSDELNIKNFFSSNNSIYIQKTSYIPYKDLNYANSIDKICMCEFHNIISIGNPLIVDKECNFNYCFNNNGKWSAGGHLININIQPIYTFNISYFSSILEKKSLNI